VQYFHSIDTLEIVRPETKTDGPDTIIELRMREAIRE